MDFEGTNLSSEIQEHLTHTDVTKNTHAYSIHSSKLTCFNKLPDKRDTTV